MTICCAGALPKKPAVQASERCESATGDEIRRPRSSHARHDMIEHIANGRAAPVLAKPIPDDVLARVSRETAARAFRAGRVYREFSEFIALMRRPATFHPVFIGLGARLALRGRAMLRKWLAAVLNANRGGRDQMPIEVERRSANGRGQCRLSSGASGIFVTGTSAGPT